MKKWIKVLIIISASILTLVLAIALLISPIAKSYIQNHDKELLGRKVRIENLRINIFTGSLDVEHLDIYEKDDKSKFITIDSFKFNMKIYPLIANKVIVQRILVSGAKVNITQKGDVFNFDDIIKKFSSSDTTPSDTNSKWEITLNNIDINKTQIIYKDLELNTTWPLEDIALNIPSIYFSNKSSDIGLKLKFQNGGSLALNAKYNMLSTKYNLDISLLNFTLKNVLPYVQQSMNVSEISGLLSTNLKIIGDVDHVMNFIVKGDIGAKDFYLKDNKLKNIVSVKDMLMKIDEVSLSKNKYHINKLELAGLSSEFDMYKNGKNNFSSLMKPEKPQATKSNSSSNPNKGKKMDFLISQLNIDNSSLMFKDQTLQRPFNYPISNINIKSQNITLDKENQLSLDANVGRSGKIKIKWKGIADGIANHNLTLIIQNLNLKELSPYVLEYFAVPITNGNLSFTSQNIIKNYNLKGTNKLDIYKCEVGKKDKSIKAEYSKIPLKLGLYVLKDRKEKINLDLPVTGNVNSPKFSYKKLILKTLGNLIVKIAMSPFSFIADQLGIKGDELSAIEIEPLQRGFTSEQFAKFKSLADISKAKPELILTLTQEANYEKCIQEFAIMDLKISYYTSKNPVSEDKKLDLVDLDEVKQIDIKSQDFISFTNNLISKKGLSIEGSIEEKAILLFKEKADLSIQNSMQRRNEKLLNHFTQDLGINPSKIRIISLSLEEIKSKSTKNQYKVSLEAEGDTSEDNSGNTAK